MRQTVRNIAGIATAFILVFPMVAAAQAPQGVGRSGYEWQTDQTLESERLKQFTVELDALPLDKWKTKALAWLELRPHGEVGSVAVSASLHVDRLDVKKASVEALEADGTWAIVPPKRKLPRSMTLVLTDPDSTEVDCPLRGVAGGTAALGIFLYDGRLFCLPRAQG